MATANTIVAMPSCAASGNTTAETAFGLPPGNTVRAFCSWPAAISSSNPILDGHQFLMRCGILITGGTTTNYAPSVRLYTGNNTGLTTFTGDTAIITPTAFAVNSVTRLWTLQAYCSWDSTTARLNGWYSHQIDTTFTAPVTLTAGLSSGVANVSNLMWCVTGFFSATNANNTAVLKYFEIDLV